MSYVRWLILRCLIIMSKILMIRKSCSLETLSMLIKESICFIIAASIFAKVASIFANSTLTEAWYVNIKLAPNKTKRIPRINFASLYLLFVSKNLVTEKMRFGMFGVGRMMPRLVHLGTPSEKETWFTETPCSLFCLAR